MTTVTITYDTIRAYHHAGRSATCVAVSAIVQSAARILDAGKALGAVEVAKEPPLFAVRAAIGDLPDGTVTDQPERARIAAQRAGRRAFVTAVFDGVAQTLSEIAALDPEALEVRDQRDRGARLAAVR
jgi:hypothetical protein